MSDSKDNQLVGRCPICPPSSAPTPDNDAYVAPDFVASDQDQYLVWSRYYELYVCQLCKKQGDDLSTDIVRDEDDKVKDNERQKMGFLTTYTTNPSINQGEIQCQERQRLKK